MLFLHGIYKAIYLTVSWISNVGRRNVNLLLFWIMIIYYTRSSDKTKLVLKKKSWPGIIKIFKQPGPNLGLLFSPARPGVRKILQKLSAGLVEQNSKNSKNPSQFTFGKLYTSYPT